MGYCVCFFVLFQTFPQNVCFRWKNYSFQTFVFFLATNVLLPQMFVPTVFASFCRPCIFFGWFWFCFSHFIQLRSGSAPPSVPNRHGSAIQAPPFRLRHVFPTRMATCGVRGEPSRRHHSRTAARWLRCFGSHCACGCLFAATSNNYFNILHPCLLLFDAIHIVPHHLSRRDLHITIVPFGFHASKPIPSPKQFRVNGLRVRRIIFCFFCSQLASCFDILRLCSWTVAAVFASNSCSRCGCLLFLFLFLSFFLFLFLFLFLFWLVVVSCCWLLLGCCWLLFLVAVSLLPRFAANRSTPLLSFAMLLQQHMLETFAWKYIVRSLFCHWKQTL